MAEKDGILIVTHYDDLIGDNTKYRTVKFTEFDRWCPLEKEIKTDKYKKYFNDKNSIKNRGVCTKINKTIGIRNNCCWLQLTFRFEWEFKKFLFDSKDYSLCDEYDRSIILKYKDLKQSDYRLLNIHEWDKYNDTEKDGKTIKYNSK